MTSMNNQSTSLLSPIELGSISMKNRVVMAPLTRNRAGAGLAPTEMNVEYYRQRASAGLIITEATLISAEGVGYPNTPGIYSEAQIEGWKKVTKAVHAEGGKIVLQIWHCGRVSHSSMLPDGMTPKAPSAIKPTGDVFTYEGMKPYETPEAMTAEDIQQIINDFRVAAYNALTAGFDGVEVHSANGYLLDQFLRDGSNQRTDAYGGSIENRARLTLEVVDEVCKIWGSDRVGIRLSPLQPFNDMKDSQPQQTFEYIIKALNKFNLAYLHITEMGSENPGIAGPEFDLGLCREWYQGNYMTNSEYTFDTANVAIKSGDADCISFGKLFIANPDLVERFATQSPLNTPDGDTFYGGDEHGYIDYPFLPEK